MSGGLTVSLRLPSPSPSPILVLTHSVLCHELLATPSHVSRKFYDVIRPQTKQAESAASYIYTSKTLIFSCDLGPDVDIIWSTLHVVL